MKKNVIHLLSMFSKYALVGIFVQCILFTLVFAAKSDAQDVKSVYNVEISIERSDLSIEELLQLIESKTNYVFAFDRRDIRTNRKVNLDRQTHKVADLLRVIAKEEHCSFKQINNNIFIKKRKDYQYSNENIQVVLQSISVSGRVTSSEDNEGLPGVNVVVKGTMIGTVTDADGKYRLEVPEESVLVFSSVGFVTEEVSIGNQSVVDLSLVPDITALDEIVVVGYGEQKKVSLTASVSTLKAAEVAQKPVVNLTNNLVGRVAGVIADQGSGEPGLDGSRLRIRGTSTTGNADPLLVVDGVYRDFSRLDPNSIETITVLKDAAAVAPYGLAGANGVILVTTKKGKTGAPNLSYDARVGFQNATRLTPMVDSYQYVQLMNEAGMNSGLPNMPFSDEEVEQYRRTVMGDPNADPDRYSNSRGLKEVLQRNALLTSHNMQLTGGTEKLKYYAGLGYTYQLGQFSSTYLKKYNAIVNLDIEATKTTNVSLSLNGWVEDQHYGGKVGLDASNPNDRYASANGGIMYQAFRTPPTSPIYYSNGLWGSYIGRSLVGYVEHSGYWLNENTQLLTSFAIEQKLPFLQGLSLKGVASYDPYSTYSKIWQTPVLSYSADFSTTPYTFTESYSEFSLPQLTTRNSLNKAFTYQGYLNYHNTFGLHNVTVLGVIEAREEKYWNIYAQRKNFPIDIDELDRGGTSEGDILNGGSSSQSTQIGYVYRVSYSYNGKYLFEAAGRYDGHYYFAPGKKYGFFPSFSVGWNIGQENFIRNNLGNIDLLKIRASYGESGNLAGGPFQYLSGYGIYGNAAFFNGAPTTGIYETNQGNPEITWEVAEKYNLGIETSLWNGKLTFEGDYFFEKRSNMLTTPNVTVPGEYGIGLNQVNAGVMDNRGVDLSLGTSHSFSNGLRLEVAGNFTYAKNRLIEVFETDATYNNPNRKRTGRPNGTMFGLEALGYFTPDDFNPDGSLKDGIASIPDASVQPGDLRYADLSGPEGARDGIIDANDETVIGHPNGTPQMIFGLSPTISWKGFDLNFLFQGAARISLPVGGSLVFPFDQQGSASELAYEDHWTPANTDALYPRVYTQQPSYNTRFSSWWVRDASYIKLRSMELGYTLPSSVVDNIGIQALRIYTSGQNLWTWTPNMKEVIDPEARSSNGHYYFQQRVISFGLNVTF